MTAHQIKHYSILYHARITYSFPSLDGWEDTTLGPHKNSIQWGLRFSDQHTSGKNLQGFIALLQIMKDLYVITNFCSLLLLLVTMAVGIVTHNWADGPGIALEWGRDFLHPDWS